MNALRISTRDLLSKIEQYLIDDLQAEGRYASSPMSRIDKQLLGVEILNGVRADIKALDRRMTAEQIHTIPSAFCPDGIVKVLCPTCMSRVEDIESPAISFVGPGPL